MQYVFYALSTYSALVTIYIVSENRRPQTSFAWMFLFLTLPGIGLVICWLFGRKNPRLWPHALAPAPGPA